MQQAPLMSPSGSQPSIKSAPRSRRTRLLDTSPIEKKFETLISSALDGYSNSTQSPSIPNLALLCSVITKLPVQTTIATRPSHRSPLMPSYVFCSPLQQHTVGLSTTHADSKHRFLKRKCPRGQRTNHVRIPEGFPTYLDDNERYTYPLVHPLRPEF